MKFALILLALALTARADTIHLATGKSLTGHVTGYANMTFTVEDDQAKATKLPAATVTSIDFEKATVPGTLDVRGKGKLQGKIWLYDKGAFSIDDEKGASQKIMAMMVTSATFGEGGSAEATGSTGEKVKVIGHGQKIDLAKCLVAGQVTIVDFYADWCGPCRQLGPQLEKIAKEDPQVVLRKMDIVQWGTPVTQQFGINAIPHVQVYGKTGKLIGEFAGGNVQELRALIAKGKSQ
jgi:thiol-disulfide isomerase/thioredoxin